MNFFEALHIHELEFIRNLQSIETPFFNECMNLLRFFDTLPFYLALVSIIWYGYQQKCGASLLFLLVLNISLNSFFKETFAEPRPFMVEPEVGLAHARFFGFPSGAAQLFSSLFGFLILTFKKPWFTVSALLFTLLICFSRVYLGLHFPSDIVGGWIFGLLILVLYWNLAPPIERFLTHSSRFMQGALAFGTPIILAGFNVIALFETKTFLFLIPGTSIVLMFRKELFPQPSYIKRLIQVLVVTTGLFFLFFLDTTPLYSATTFFVVGIWLSYGIRFKPNPSFK